MNLVWHIAKKDLRRMAAPVAVWLTLILAGALWFRIAQPMLVGHFASEIDEWGSLVTIWSVLLTVAELMLAIVLTGALMLEDRVASPNAFWPTRPIGGGRLLAAKALAAFLCFIVAPVVVLTPVWLSISFSPAGILAAAVNFATTFGFAVLFAMAVASLVKGLGELALMVTVLGLGCWIALIPGMRGDAGALHVSVAMRCAFVVLFGGVLFYQCRTRWTRNGWIALTGGVCLALIVAWSDSGPKPRHDAQTERPVGALPAPPAEVARTITAPGTLWKRAANVVPVYRVVMQPEPGVYFAPGVVRDSRGRIVLMPRSWGQDIAARAVGVSEKPTAIWDLFPATDPGWTENNPVLVGSLDIWRVRPVIIGEVPLRVGAKLADASGRLRVAAISESPGAVILEEREVAPEAIHDFPSSLNAFTSRDAESRVSVDIYVCVDRRSRQGFWMWNDSQVSHVARHNGQALGYRRLGPDGLRGRDDMSLVKVRLECERVYELPIDVHGVTKDAPPDGRRTSNIQH